MCNASDSACRTSADLACGARRLLSSGLDLLVTCVGPVLARAERTCRSDPVECLEVNLTLAAVNAQCHVHART